MLALRHHPTLQAIPDNCPVHSEVMQHVHCSPFTVLDRIHKNQVYQDRARSDLSFWNKASLLGDFLMSLDFSDTSHTTSKEDFINYLTLLIVLPTPKLRACP